LQSSLNFKKFNLIVNLLKFYYILKNIIKTFGTNSPFFLFLFYQGHDMAKILKLWGDEILADMPSCLEGEDHGINTA